MLEKIKLALRIKSSVTDDDIKDLILAAKTDLSISGVKKIEDDNPLIIQAVKLYCKTFYAVENKDMERYQKAYDALKISLAVCGDYNVG